MADGRFGVVTRVYAFVYCCVLFGGCASAPVVEPSDRVIPSVPGGRRASYSYLRNPVLRHLRISPDGSHIAAIASRGNKDLLLVTPAAGGHLEALVEVVRDRFGIAQTITRIGWASDDCVLMLLEEPRFVSRIESRRSRLFAVDIDGNRVQYLGESWPEQDLTGDQGDIISWLRDDPDHVLLSLRLARSSYPAALEVDVRDGSFDTVESAQWGIHTWYADHRGRVLAALGTSKPRGSIRDKELQSFFLARTDPDAELEEIARWRPYEEDGLTLASFTDRPDVILVAAPVQPGARLAIFELDLNTKRLGKLVYQRPGYDIRHVVTSSVDGRPLYVAVDAERPELHFLDLGWEALHARLDRALPDRINRVVSRNRDETKLIVKSSSDVVPPEYYLYDRNDEGLNLIVRQYPELADVALSPMEPVTYVARDGLTIHGYLTRPADAPEGPLATIVYPHGGPWSRDVWGWDAIVQFFAARGFAVFQPNFRGSFGYGADFEAEGYGEWGLAMQNDITDGVRWLVEEGIADPDRIGIFGMSYGGYAALQGLASTPELYRAGASFAGVSDLRLFMSWANMRLRYIDVMEKLVGDRRDDQDRLDATSPAQNARSFRAPVLLGHGTRDSRVDVAQSEAMERALRRADRPVELVLYKDELHWFLDDRNATEFFTKVGDFFERYLEP